MHFQIEEIVLQSFNSLYQEQLLTYRGLYRGETALCFSCFHRETVQHLWEKRRELSDKVLMLGLAQWVILCLDGEIYCPPWRVTADSSKKMIQVANLTLSDGDIAKRILDSGLSCGVVDFKTNILLCASQEIIKTSGRDAFAIQGKDLNDLWDKQILADLNRDLQQQGKLTDARYTAKSWVHKEGIWQTEEHGFRAHTIEVVKFLGRWCRLTYGVQIDN